MAELTFRCMRVKPGSRSRRLADVHHVEYRHELVELLGSYGGRGGSSARHDPRTRRTNSEHLAAAGPPLAAARPRPYRGPAPLLRSRECAHLPLFLSASRAVRLRQGDATCAADASHTELARREAGLLPATRLCDIPLPLVGGGSIREIVSGGSPNAWREMYDCRRQDCGLTVDVARQSDAREPESERTVPAPGQAPVVGANSAVAAGNARLRSLQQSAGNAAVARHLASASPSRTVGRAPAAPVAHSVAPHVEGGAGEHHEEGGEGRTALAGASFSREFTLIELKPKPVGPLMIGAKGKVKLHGAS